MKLINADYLTGRIFTEADLTNAHTCYDSIRTIVESMETVDSIPTQAVEDAITEIKKEISKETEDYCAIGMKRALEIICEHTGIGE